MTPPPSRTRGGVVGRRHHDSCQCGCHLVIGLSGRVVEDADTPKLAELGLVYCAFTKDRREIVVCYDLEEISHRALDNA